MVDGEMVDGAMVDGEMVRNSLLLSDWPRVDWRLTGFSGRRRGACAVQSPVEQSVGQGWIVRNSC